MKKNKHYYSSWRDIQCTKWASEELSAGDIGPLQHSLVSGLVRQYSGSRERVLDVGCAAGTSLSMIDNIFEEKWGVDLVEWPQWKGFQDIKFKVADLDKEGLPFPDSYFSVVICSNVLEHVFDVFEAVEELVRVCEQDGHIIVGVPNCAYIKQIYRLLSGWSPRTATAIFPFNKESGWDGQHLHMFSLREMRILLGEAGLAVRAVRGTGRFMKLRSLWPSLLYADMYFVAQKKV